MQVLLGDDELLVSFFLVGSCWYGWYVGMGTVNGNIEFEPLPEVGGPSVSLTGAHVNKSWKYVQGGVDLSTSATYKKPDVLLLVTSPRLWDLLHHVLNLM